MFKVKIKTALVLTLHAVRRAGLCSGGYRPAGTITAVAAHIKNRIGFG
jgi:hypothetical protein